MPVKDERPVFIGIDFGESVMLGDIQELDINEIPNDTSDHPLFDREGISITIRRVSNNWRKLHGHPLQRKRHRKTIGIHEFLKRQFHQPPKRRKRSRIWC